MVRDLEAGSLDPGGGLLELHSNGAAIEVMEDMKRENKGEQRNHEGECFNRTFRSLWKEQQRDRRRGRQVGDQTQDVANHHLCCSTFQAYLVHGTVTYFRR